MLASGTAIPFSQLWLLESFEATRSPAFIHHALFRSLLLCGYAVPCLISELMSVDPPCIMYIELVSRSHMRASRLPQQLRMVWRNRSFWEKTHASGSLIIKYMKLWWSRPAGK